jgi:Leucine-rich repeat (LRR) protein
MLFLLTELCKLNKLEELELYGNLFEGILPPCLNNMTSLRLLDICENQFTGNISSNLIAIPTSLEYIDLSYNLFEGLF